MKRISLAALLAAIPAVTPQDAATAPATSTSEMHVKSASDETQGKVKLKPMLEVACCTRPTNRPDTVFPPKSGEDFEFIR
jgi:hypothetical protein